jgi:hypothetical protein
MGWAEEIIWGNPCDLSLPFHRNHVELNLPGSVSYDPSQPWVSKRRWMSNWLQICNHIATIFGLAVRVAGQLCWQHGKWLQSAITLGFRMLLERGAFLLVTQVCGLVRWHLVWMQVSLARYHRKSGIKREASFLVFAMCWRIKVGALSIQIC